MNTGLSMNHILGNSELHERFAEYVEILYHFVHWEPFRANARDLARLSHRSAHVLKHRCNVLVREGILEEFPDSPRSWRLLKPISEVTLADVFRCATTSAPERNGNSTPPSTKGDGTDAVSIFLMQAMLAVYNHIYKHLETYSLACLQASGKGILSTVLQHDLSPDGNRYVVSR